jgi:PAS domain S-box-containing protein
LKTVFFSTLLTTSFLYASPVTLTDIEKSYLKDKKTITMCIDPDWMPFEKFDDKKNHIGMSADYFDIFQQNLNKKIEVIYTKNWTESLNVAQSRGCDLMSLVMETPSRKEFLNFTTPYLQIPLVFATKVQSQFINEIKDLKGKVLGIPKGYAFGELLKNKYPFLTIVNVQNVKDGLEQVHKGEIYAYVGTLASVGYELQKSYATEIKIAGKFDDNWELGIGVRNDDQTLLKIMQKVVNSLEDDQKREILNKWIAVKYEQKLDTDMLWKIFGVLVLVVLFFLYKQHMMKKSIQEFSELIDATMEGIIVSKNGICIDVNESLLKLTGFAQKEEVIGKSLLDFVSEPYQNIVQNKFKEYETEPYEIQVIKKDGSLIDALVRGHQLKQKDLRITSLIDISVLKRQESILVEQSKMAALGEMIGNIAHQWRQPLSVISTGATGLKIAKEYGTLTDKLFSETCDQINDNAQYLSHTIDDFKNYIKGERKSQTFDLKDNIESFLHLIEGSVKKYDIKIINNIDRSIMIHGYSNELLQCYLNIFNNAKDVFVSNEQQKKLFIIDVLENEKDVVILLKDNGGGIPEKIISRIFEPYFTTKHKSQGTGLGLHMTYNLITKGMDGNIEVKNISYTYNEENYNGAQMSIQISKNL